MAHLGFVSGDLLAAQPGAWGVANVGAGARRGGRARGRQAAPERHWICRTAADLKFCLYVRDVSSVPRR